MTAATQLITKTELAILLDRAIDRLLTEADNLETSGEEEVASTVTRSALSILAIREEVAHLIPQQ